MKESKKEYWQDRASNIVVIAGVVISLLIPLVFSPNVRSFFTSFNYGNRNSTGIKNQKLTKREVSKLRQDFEQQIKSTQANQYRQNYLLDNRSQNEKERRGSFVSAWSKREPELAAFFGEWYGYEQALSIYPSTIKNQVCIINTEEGFGDFTTGKFSNGAIITSDGIAIITNKKYMATYRFEDGNWIYSNEVPLNSPMPLRSVNDIIGDVYEVYEKNNIVDGFYANGCTFSTDVTDKSNASNNIKTIFDNDSFPKESCGDPSPTNINDYPVDFYPVYAEPTAGILQYIKVNFCRDAYSMTRKDIGQRATQVGSFTSYERAEQFSKFLQQRIGSGEIGQPRRVEKTPY